MKGLLFPTPLPSPQWSCQNVGVPFSSAHRPKDLGPSNCSSVDWAWFTATKGSCLRTKWCTWQASYNTYKLAKKTRIFVLNNNENSKEMQSNQEIHKTVVRDPRINERYFINFL